MTPCALNRPRRAWLTAVLAIFWLSALPAAALESQALPIAESVPAEVRQVLPCGQWTEGQRSGHYRLVLVDVNQGAGTEVYIQRLHESVKGSTLSLKLLETTTVRELNNDHAQYQVSSARCTGTAARASFELIATFEHDEGNVEHRVRIRLAAPGSYPVSDKPHLATTTP